MEADDLLDDGKTETGARDTARDTGFDPLEAIENARKILRQEPIPSSRTRDDDVVASLRVAIVTVPPAGEYFTALLTRFVIA